MSQLEIWDFPGLLPVYAVGMRVFRLGAEAALEHAILQDQFAAATRETATVSVMNMHQLKGRECDAVVLVEDQYNTFFAQDKTPPHADTRRLLQVSLMAVSQRLV